MFFPKRSDNFNSSLRVTKLTGVQVKYIWRSKWNHIKVLYLLSRFSPYVDTPLAAASMSPTQRPLPLAPDLSASVHRS